MQARSWHAQEYLWWISPTTKFHAYYNNGINKRCWTLEHCIKLPHSGHTQTILNNFFMPRLGLVLICHQMYLQHSCQSCLWFCSTKNYENIRHWQQETLQVFTLVRLPVLPAASILISEGYTNRQRQLVAWSRMRTRLQGKQFFIKDFIFNTSSI